MDTKKAVSSPDWVQWQWPEGSSTIWSAFCPSTQGLRTDTALSLAIYLSGTFGSALSTIYAYNASNTSGHTKKSTVNALTLVAFSVGNIIGSEIFAPKDAPAYIPGKIAIMVLLSVQLFISFFLRWVNLRMNKKKAAHIEEIKRQRGWNDEDIQRERNKHAFGDLTDKE